MGYFSTNSTLDTTDTIFRENDADTVSAGGFGDRLTTLTVRNNGTLPDEEIAAITLLENGTRIQQATTATNGTWVFDIAPENGTIRPGDGTAFTLETTLADSAAGGETVELVVPPVNDSGTAGVYDPDDNGAFFEQGSPIGDIGPGPTLSVAVDSSSTAASTPASISIDVSIPAENLSTHDPTIPVRIETGVPDRTLQVSLVNVTTKASVAEQLLIPDSDGSGQVSFDTRDGRFRVRVTEPRSGSVGVSDGFTVAPPVSVAFSNQTYTVSRGAVATVDVSLRNAESVAVRLVGPTGKPVAHRAIPDGSAGRVPIALDTATLGPGGNGTGLAIAGPPAGGMGERPPGPAGRARSNRSKTSRMESARPNGTVHPTPRSLGVGRYDLSLIVDGNVSDSASLVVTDQWSGEVETLVAPAGVNRTDLDQLTSTATSRSRIAAGDTLVMRVSTSGLGPDARQLAVAHGRPAAGSKRDQAPAFTELRRAGGPPEQGGTPATHLHELETPDPETLLFVLPTEANGTAYVRAGTRYRAGFGLTETSPLVAGARTPDTIEREEIETSLSVIPPMANFSSLSANDTLDLPQTANATIAGETTVAPHTTATVHVVSTDENETFAIAAETTIDTDGSYETTVDLSEYDAGTNYTVSVSANDEQISPLMTGSIEGTDSATFGAAGGSSGGYADADSGGGGPGSTPTTVDSIDPVETTHTTADPVRSLSHPSIDDLEASVWKVLPKPLRIGAPILLVAGLGLLAIAMVFVGIRRLL